MPFAAVADATLARGYATIQRTDRERVVTVTGDVDRAVATPEQVLTDVVKDMPGILADYPGVSYRLGGEQRERDDAMVALGVGALLALLLIYALLAISAQGRILQPLVIMSVIPFGAVGAILGHLIIELGHRLLLDSRYRGALWCRRERVPRARPYHQSHDVTQGARHSSRP